LGTSAREHGYGVAVDSSDNLYIMGLGGNILLVKYNSGGVKQ